MPPIFPTFCHITEYKEEAYRNLHRLVATSDQLVLWAPSWKLMTGYYEKGVCRVSPKLLLGLLDDHRGVQVIGRTEWLLDKTYRQSHGFEGAEWSKHDETLLSIWKNDERGRVPEPERAVRLAPPGRGWEAAAAFLSNHPQIESEIQTWIKRKKVPIGSLEKIRSGRYPGRRPAEIVVRDAVNHADAVQLAETEDMWLSARDGRFLQLMNQCAPRDAKPLRSAQEAQHLRNFKTAVEEILEDLDKAGLSLRAHEMDASTLLRRVAARFGRGQREASEQAFEGFLKSEGRKRLLEWMSTYSQFLRYVPTERLGETVREFLAAGIQSGSERGGILKAFDFTGPDLQKFQVLGGGLICVLAFMVDPHAVIGIAGIVFGVLPAARYGLYKAGLLPGREPSPHFPFTYGFGRTGRYPTPRMIHAILKTLEVKPYSGKRS